MALFAVDGEIRDSSEPAGHLKPAPRKSLIPGISIGPRCFFSPGDSDGDMEDYLNSLKKKGYKTKTIDVRFYILHKLRRCLEMPLTIRGIREHLRSIPNPRTRQKTLRCLLCYASYRSEHGDPSLLTGILTDATLRPGKLRL